MKIFLPFKNELNPYLEEIIINSAHTFVYDSYNKYNASYDIVNIHWPEAIYEWMEPTSKELEDLEKNILEWKKNSVLIYTKHDYQRNKGTTSNFTKLFKLIELHSDIFIHLGHYSKNLYEQKYPNAKHEIVFHPIFENSLEIYSKRKARKLLGIDQDDIVIIAPGNIRSFKERKMVLKSFKSIKLSNKVLISTNMRSELQHDFPGRVRMRQFFDVQTFFVERFKHKHLPPKFIFNYGVMDTRSLSLRMSAADVVLVPRVDILNSGIVFLGLSFGKVIVGPAVGNIEEQLKELSFPIFNPHSISSVAQALNKGIKISINENDIKKPLAKYSAINVAKEFDRILLNINKS